MNVTQVKDLQKIHGPNLGDAHEHATKIIPNIAVAKLPCKFLWVTGSVLFFRGVLTDVSCGHLHVSSKRWPFMQCAYPRALSIQKG